MNDYKVGDRVYWKSEKEKVEINHIRRDRDNRLVVYVKSKKDGLWSVYYEAIKPIITVRA